MNKILREEGTPPVLPPRQMTGGIILKQILSNREKEEAYKLRYEIFYRQHGVDKYADHDSQTYRDSQDVSALMFVAEDPNGSMVATTRLSLRSSAPFLSDHIYRYDLIAAILGTDEFTAQCQTCLTERTVSISCPSSVLVVPELIQYVEEVAVVLEQKFIIAAITNSKPARIKWCRRRGYSVYGADAMVHGFDAILLGKRLGVTF